MNSKSNLYAFLRVATWVLAGIVLLTSYVAVSIHTINPWPWHEVVHESGDRTLLGTILYLEHAARELSLDLLLGVAVGGSVLFAFPPTTKLTRVAHRIRLGTLAAGTLMVIGTILGGTFWTGGIDLLFDNLLQLYTRPESPLIWGAHWRYHFLSRAMLMLFTLGIAGMFTLITKRKTCTSSRAGLALFGSAVGLFALLTTVFTLNSDPFQNPTYLGHQIREVLTHVLVTLPLAWWACLVLAAGELEIVHDEPPRVFWPLAAGVGSLLIGSFLLVRGLMLSAETHGQTQDVILLLFPHFFEHTFTYIIVALVAALAYEWAGHRSSDFNASLLI